MAEAVKENLELGDFDQEMCDEPSGPYHLRSDSVDKDETIIVVPFAGSEGSGTLRKGNQCSVSGFVGLQNQRATCYLNSLIQHLYMTPEFRFGIYALTEDELGLTEEEDDGEDIPESIPARPLVNSSFLNELTSMGFSENLSIKALQETTESGRESVQRAAEWLLMHSDDDESIAEVEKGEAIKQEIEAPKKRIRRRKIPIELARLFAFLQSLDTREISTKSLTESFGWSGNEIGQQHDVHELNRVLFEAIEASLCRTGSQNLLNNLYRGTLVNKVRCLTCGYTSEREEHFQDVTTVVKNMSSLVYSLEDFVQPQLLSEDNQYFCEQCGGKSDAKRWVCFRETPSVLIFSLARFEYDFITGNRKKNSDHFHYPLTLDMAPYIEANVDSFTPTSLPKSAKELSLFEPTVDSKSEHLYDLFTVIIHTGKSGNYGHYHAYIKDVLDEGHWTYQPMKPKLHETTSVRKKHQRSASDDMNAPAEPSLPFLRDLEATLDLSIDKENLAADDNIAASPVVSPAAVQCSSNNSSNILEIPQFKKKEDENEPKTRFLEDDNQQGGWFDFNDSSVSPIPLKTLRTQFGGKSECAYMLVYRKRNSSLPLKKPVVPPYLQVQVAEKNEKIHEERKKKELEDNRIEIYIYRDSHFEVDSLGIARKLLWEKTSDIPRITVVIDRRQKLAELCNEIQQILNLKEDDRSMSSSSPMILHSMRILQERLILPSPQNPITGDDKSLVDLGISTGMELLFWDGCTINGVPWDPFNQVVTVNLFLLSTYHTTETPYIIVPRQCTSVTRPLEITNFSFEITRTTSLYRLYQLVESHTNIPVSEQKVVLFEARYDKENITLQSELPTVSENTPSDEKNSSSDLSLRDFDVIQNSCMITVERKSNDNLALEFLSIKNEMIQVNVKNNLNGNTRPELNMLKIVIRQTSTLGDMKKDIISYLALSNDLDMVRFRRIRPEGFSGTLYQNESIPVVSIPLINGSQIIVESGESPSSKSIKIQCKLSNEDVLGDGDTFDTQLVTINKDWTIKKCIEVIKEVLGAPDSEKFVLRRTDLWGNITHTIHDEMHTAQQAKLVSGGTYILSQPTRGGRIPISLVLFECNDREYPGFMRSSFCSPVTDIDIDELNFSLKDELDTDNESPFQWNIYSPALSLDMRSVPGSYSVTSLGSFYLEKARSLFQCKEYLIRSVPLLAAANSPFHIRLWCNNRILKGHGKELQDFQQTSGTLAVQVLDHSEDLTENIICLIIFRRDPSRCCYLRPVEYLYDVTQHIENPLLTCLSIDFGIPKESLQSFHYNVSTQKWSPVGSPAREISLRGNTNVSNQMDLGELFTGVSTSDTLNIENKHDLKNKDNAKQYNDGDIIVLKDLRSEGSNKDIIDVERLSSIRLDAQTQSKSHQHKTSWREFPRREEAQLRIHVDSFDFEEKEKTSETKKSLRTSA